MTRRKGFSKFLATTLVMLMVLAMAYPAMAAQVQGSKETYEYGDDTFAKVQKLYAPGDTIYYIMVIENPLDNDQTNYMTRIWDTLPDGNVIEFGTATLMPGEIATYFAEYTVKPTDHGTLINTFEAMGTDTAGDTLRVLITKNALVAELSISITKTVSHASSKVGDDVIYTITVTNTGDYPLANMVVTDSLLGGDITDAFEFDAAVDVNTGLTTLVLEPGAANAKTAVITHKILEADLVDGVLLNTVRVDANAFKYPLFKVWDTAQATVTMVNPDFTITKTADTAVSKTTDPINYTVTVTNTGDVKMEFRVTDSMKGLLFDDIIEAGTKEVFTYQHIVTDADYPGPLTNVVTAVATLRHLNLPNSYTKTASVSTRLVTPGIEITKTVNPAQAPIDGEVTYTIRVTNTGDYALENMAVNDTMFGNITAQFGFGATLAVDEWKEITIPYTIQTSDYPGPLVNTANVLANPVGLPNEIRDQDSATVTILINPGISITKDVSHTTSKVGDKVTYTIVVTNTGDIALENMVVTDALLGGNITSKFEFDATLAPGASKRAEIDYIVLEGDVENDLLLNTVTVDANALGLPAVTVSDEDDARVLMVNPNFTITKTADTAVSKTTDPINYTVTVTNTGDVKMEFRVTDSMKGLLFDDIIEAGSKEVFTYQHIVTDADYPGPLTNVVTAVATLRHLNLPNSYTKTASVSTPLVTPAVTITKTVNPVEAYIGDVVTYTIRVENTGDWALTNMKVMDTMFGDITSKFGFGATLAVGDWKQITLPYTILSTDYPGYLVNTADVYANPVGLPNHITDEDSATVTVLQRICYMDETAWAFGGQYANPNWDYVNNRFWGWTNGPLSEGDYVFDIYAAAGQNDLSKGTLVGELHVSYHNGTVTVTYKMFDDNYMSEVHLWVGNEPLPMKRGSYTNAPGQFPYGGSDGFVSGTNQGEWTWTGTGFTGDIYVAAHSVVQIAYPCDGTTEPIMPIEPGIPGGPTVPGKPETPGGPPTAPGKPEVPGGPTAPVEPEIPGGPPTAPGRPETPGRPTSPGKSSAAPGQNK